RLGSLVTLDELAPQLLATVVETVGTTVGVIYLRDDQDARYHATIAVGTGRPTEGPRADQSMRASLKTAQTPLVLESDGVHQWLEPRVARVFTDVSVLVPLRWRDELTGFLLIGPERTGVSYTIEDLEFMATVGEQAAAAIVTARLSETLAQARGFGAFHRPTSCVIHHVETSISSPATLSA